MNLQLIDSLLFKLLQADGLSGSAFFVFGFEHDLHEKQFSNQIFEGAFNCLFFLPFGDVLFRGI